MGKALSGAEREQKAGERLAENRAQLAAIQGRMAQGQSALDALQRMEQSAAANVTAAEQAVEQAAQQVIDAHAAAMVADGDADLMAAHGAAVDARKAARAALDEARAALEATRAKVATESAPIKQQLAEDDDTRGDVQRLIQSLERAQVKAHHDAGIERLQAAQERHTALQARLSEQRQAVADTRADLDAHHDELAAIADQHPELAKSREYGELADPQRGMREICAAFTAYLDELERWRGDPDAVGVWHNGLYLPNVLTDQRFFRSEVFHGIFTDQRQIGQGTQQQHKMLITRVRNDVAHLLEVNAKQRAFAISSWPAAIAE